MIRKRWVLSESITDAFAQRFPETPRIVLQILVNRGVLRLEMSAGEAQAALDEFMNPDYGTDIHDPFLFRDMQKAVDRIRRAIDEKEKIIVYGDYDADGVSGAVILMTTLQALGAEVEVYIPHRETEGYGVNVSAVDTIVQGGARLIVTCDCGISNTPEITHAVKQGIDVIITDHHAIPGQLPPAYAIIHPLVPGENYPFKGLAGGGVAFKFAQALLRTIDPSPSIDPPAFEKWLLDMVVVSTVADMMPLLGENRTLAMYGLIVLNKTKRIGLQKLIEKAELARNGRVLDTYSIGWGIAPRINAAGRMDHANTAYQLCVTTDPKEADALADALNAANQERQSIVKKLVDEAMAMIGDARGDQVLIVHGKDWPLGLVGLVAGKITDQLHRPAIVMTDRQGEIAGSGRSIAGFNLMHALQSLPPTLFKKFGGHPMACGFTLASTGAIGEFTTALRAYAGTMLTAELLVSALTIDGVILLRDIHWELWDHLEHLEPFGEKNQRPRYVAEQVSVTAIRRIGADGQHVRCTVEQNGVSHSCIAFGATKLFDDVHIGDMIDIAFEINVNEWNGNRTLQLQIIDIKKSETLNSKS